MNRIIIFISMLILVSVVFCACGDNEQTVSRTTTAPLSEIATSLVKSNNEGKTVIYETDKRETERCHHGASGNWYGGVIKESFQRRTDGVLSECGRIFTVRRCSAERETTFWFSFMSLYL